MTRGKLNSFLSIVLCSLFFCLALGCGSKKVVEKTVVTDFQKIYNDRKSQLEKTDQISPGFTLRIRHSVDGNINGEYKVDFKGQLNLPYKVKIEAAGISTAELESRLANAYKSFIKSNNVFAVTIIKRNYLIEVRGLVEKPGIYEINLDTSLEEIISQAGGLQTGAAAEKAAGSGTKPEFVRILKADFMGESSPSSVHWVRLADYFLKYDVTNEILWRGGERLFFQVAGDTDALARQTNTIQIMGEVHKPGEYPIVANADLYQYISSAGGPLTGANLEEVTIIHRTSGGATSVDIVEGTKIVPLTPGDVILIKANKSYNPTLIERAVPVLMGITSIITSTVLIVFAI